MGLKRRVADPVKVVSMTDDAIDWSATPRLDYAESRDPELVKALPGREDDLVWFTVAPLESELASHVKTIASPHREWTAFMYGVVAVSKDLGLEWSREGGRAAVTRKSMQSLTDDVIEEIGRVSLMLGNLTLGEGSRSGR